MHMHQKGSVECWVFHTRFSWPLILTQWNFCYCIFLLTLVSIALILYRLNFIKDFII